jgi:O-antigen/teichoic acid export membrane protein
VGIATGSLVALVFRILGAFLWAIVGVLTARAFSVEERGVNASIIVFAAAIAGITSLGGAAGYYVSNRKRLVPEVVANSLSVALPVAVLFVVVGFLLELLIEGDVGRLMALSGLLILPSIIRNTVCGAIIGAGRLIEYNVATNLPVVLGFFTLLTWVVFLDNRTAEAGLAAWAAAQYVSLLPLVFWGGNWLTWFREHRPDPALIKGVVRFTAVTGMAGVVGLLNYRVDLLLVISLDSREGAGIYSSAISAAEALWLFSSAIAMASFARVGRESREEAARLTATGVRHSFLVVVPAAIAASIIGPTFIELVFGAKYAAAAAPLRILCIGTAVFASQSLLSNYYTNQLGRPSIPLVLGLIALVLSVAGSLLLIPSYGAVGAAWATTISYAVTGFVSFALFLWLSNAHHSELWRIRRSDILSYFYLAGDILRRLGVHTRWNTARIET